MNNCSIVGIVNVTPDSFSDGGRFVSPEDAVEWAIQLVEDGADMLDIGGESSRPGAASISADEEMARVLPVIEGIRRAHNTIQISIDTTKSTVAIAAIEAGATCVNDISAGRFDPEMFGSVAELGVPMILMHMQGTPQMMQTAPHYNGVTDDVRSFLADRVSLARKVGIRDLIVDPGIGFGKTVEHNATLLTNLRRFTDLGCPVLVGASRKSFIGHILGGAGVTERLEGSLAAVAVAVENGAGFVRVHDVAATRRFLTVFRALRDAK